MSAFVYSAVRTPFGRFGGALAVVLENVEVAG
jgi:hypothetical protein